MQHLKFLDLIEGALNVSRQYSQRLIQNFETSECSVRGHLQLGTAMARLLQELPRLNSLAVPKSLLLVDFQG